MMTTDRLLHTSASYAAAIQAARDQRERAEQAAAHSYREALHRAEFRFQEAITEARRVDDRARGRGLERTP